ncbi:MAG: DNA translocase FtsK 4TM domain-containing protein, partial [Hyphomicrobiaceae bacterium]
MSLRHQSLPNTSFLPQAVEDLLRTWSYRLAGAGLGALAALIWLCLLTWTAQSGDDLSGASRNILGPLGSIIADLLFQSLGQASVVAVVPVVFFGVELFWKERVTLLSARLIYWPVSIALIAGGMSSLPTFSAWPLQHGFGGFVGDFLYSFLRQIVDTVAPSLGGVIAGLALWITGFALLFRTLNLQPRDLWLLLEFDAGPDADDDGVATRAGPFALFRNMFGRWRRRGVARDETAPGSFAGAVQPGHDMHFETHFAAVTAASMPPENAPHPADSSIVQPAAPADRSFDAHVDDDALFAPIEPTARSLDLDDIDEIESAGSRTMAARFAPVSAKTAAKKDVPKGRSSPIRLPKPPFMMRTASDATTTSGSEPPLRSAAFQLPSVKLLALGKSPKRSAEFNENVIRGNARLLEDVLADFGVKGQIVGVHPGPVVTLYELEPARGVKAARVIGLADDIARSMSAHSARVAVVPGKNAIGIELPNAKREPVLLRQLLDDPAFGASDAKLPMAIGKAIDGTAVVTDLARMPHLLVAGTTGSGKSVGINAMILSLLYRHTPANCRFIMIDPKMLELSVYNGIPHLLTPVVTDPRKAVLALNWAVREMEERYKRMSELGVRNMDVYNARLADAEKENKPIHRTVQTGFDRDTGEPVYENRMVPHTAMASIVIVVDEMADLMMMAGKEIEATVQRLAQMARA